MRLLLLPTLLLAGCACPAARLDSGVLEAVVDGEPFHAENAQASLSSTGLHLSAGEAGGVLLSLLALESEDGEAVDALIEGGELPATVRLGTSEDGGWAMLQTSGGSTASTSEAGGGSLLLRALDGGELLGCFSFEAGLDGVVSTSVEDGAFRVALER